MKIGKRLLFIANKAGHCHVLGDVGTDHALVPVYAVTNGLCERAIASDIGKGPIERAEKNISANNLSEKIETRLCPGLSGYKPGECDRIVIAGMGGNLIADILRDSPDVAKNTPGLILSPNSCEDVLREFLYTEGYEIRDEWAVCEGRHEYLVIESVFTGTKKEITDKTLLYTGTFLAGKTDEPDVREYLKRVKRKTDIAVRGNEDSERPDRNLIEELKKVSLEIGRMLEK